MEPIEIVTQYNEKNEVRVKTSREVNFEEILQVSFSGILALTNTLLENVPEEDRPTAKEMFYDMLNIAASNALSIFAPEIEMRPNLTVDAIMKAEDEIIASYESGEALAEQYGAPENIEIPVEIIEEDGEAENI